MDRDPMELALSTDVVMDILLSYLEAGDLLSCRLASKFWKKAASSVIRKRSTMMKTITTEKELLELEECMKQSSDFPFAGVDFYAPWKVHSAGARRFFKNYGGRFTRLKVYTNWLDGLHLVDPFLNHLPRLSILEVVLYRPTYTMTMGLGTGPTPRKVLKLPSVRTIRFLGPCSMSVTEEVFREVITAASPSVRIECLDVNPVLVRALQSAGRLRSVSFMTFDEAVEDDYRDRFSTEMDHLLSMDSPSLTRLNVHGRGSLSSKGLEKILLSSQHTLKELHLEGSWFSEDPWENFPVLNKLTKLRLNVANAFCDGSLFRGRHGHKFPALKELHLDFHYDNQDGNVRPGFSSGLFVVPTVTMLELMGYVDKDGMERLAQSFPHVLDMRVYYGFYNGDYDYGPCGRDPFEIWNVAKFKSLEKLRIWNFPIKQLSKNYVNMDSFITGIPDGISENLRKREPLNLINSPFDEVLRDSPSILHLESLKELVICVYSGLYEPVEDPPFISMVSVKYALEMLPNLRWKFVYEPAVCPVEDRSLLEAFFEHVQPYIKLEPFFY